jgi:hypothetical protein
MSNDIKVGDVCEIITACCPQARAHVVGREVTILGIRGSGFQCGCCGEFGGLSYSVDSSIPSPEDEGTVSVVPHKFLRKKPPKQADDAEPRSDYTPANTDDWPLTHWDPSKAKEPA